MRERFMKEGRYPYENDYEAMMLKNSRKSVAGQLCRWMNRMQKLQRTMLKWG